MPARIVRTSLVLAASLGLMSQSTTIYAHDDDPIEHAFEHWAGFPSWLPLVGATVTLLLMLGIAAFALWRQIRRSAPLLPSGTEGVAQSLLAWLFLGYVQNLLPGAPFLLTLGYAILPLSLLTVWAFVWNHAGGTIRLVFGQRRYLLLTVAVSVLFAGFYLWSTNLVAPPEPDEMPAPGTLPFLVLYQAYGPLAIWPNIEFWIPSLTLFGAISVGTAMVVLTLGFLMGTNIALLAFSLAHRHACYRGSTVLGSSIVAALGTNFCCCCAPALYPLLALVLGTNTASSLAVWMIGSSSPFYNLFQVAALSIATISAILTARQIRVQAGMVSQRSHFTASAMDPIQK